VTLRFARWCASRRVQPGFSRTNPLRIPPLRRTVKQGANRRWRSSEAASARAVATSAVKEAAGKQSRSKKRPQGAGALGRHHVFSRRTERVMA